MLLLIQLITKTLQDVIPVAPVFFNLDEHFQEYFLSEEFFDILAGHGAYFFQCLSLMSDNDPFLGITLYHDQGLDVYQLFLFLKQTTTSTAYGISFW